MTVEVRGTAFRAWRSGDLAVQWPSRDLALAAQTPQPDSAAQVGIW